MLTPARKGSFLPERMTGRLNVCYGCGVRKVARKNGMIFGMVD